MDRLATAERGPWPIAPGSISGPRSWFSGQDDMAHHRRRDPTYQIRQVGWDAGFRYQMEPRDSCPGLPSGKYSNARSRGTFFMYAESSKAAKSCFGWTPSMRRILFVDDHPIYRDGVRRVLESSGPDVQVFTADGASSALRLLTEVHEIDLCLTDQRLLDGSGADLARRVRELYPSIAVGLLCAEPTLTLANEMRAIGAVACLSKDRDTSALCDAIDTLYSGGRYSTIPPGRARENGACRCAGGRSWCSPRRAFWTSR